MPTLGEAATEFSERFRHLLGRTAPEAIKAYGFVRCQAAGWVRAGVAMEAGDRATALAAWPAEAVPVSRPPLQLSMRVGMRGVALQGRCNTHSIVAPGSGPLEVLIDMPARAQDYHPAPPAAMVVAIVWRASALRGLRFVANAGDVDGLVRDEINRLCNPAAAPATPARDDARGSSNVRTS